MPIEHGDSWFSAKFIEVGRPLFSLSEERTIIQVELYSLEEPNK